MAEHRVTFEIQENSSGLSPQTASTHTLTVPTGTLLIEAAQKAGVEIMQPCGSQGRCGRCVLQVTAGDVRRRSTLRLSAEDIEQGYALACQSIVEDDLTVLVPPQEKIERLLTSDRTVAEISVPFGYDPERDQTIQRRTLRMTPPDISDQTDDWSRIKTALRNQASIEEVHGSLSLLRRLGQVLRAEGWQVTAILDDSPWDSPTAPPRLIDIRPGFEPYDKPIWGVAIDIGTTTVSVWLVDLVSGGVKAQVAEYNGQIARGEDVVSRIIYTNRNGGGAELRGLVLSTINSLIETACKRVKADPPLTPADIVKAAIVGNSTMIHLLLGIPAENIRLMPFITTANQIPSTTAAEVGLNIHPDGSVDCLPGVASYVGADITAGVLASGVDETDKVTLFLDVGTNGEIVLGSREWLVTCACSAGPAFEGAGVGHGMRATRGAIEEVWINGETYEPTYRVIGGGKPRGICGSGLISLLAEVFLTGIVDKAGNFNNHLETTRVRQGEHGWEYVIARGEETAHGEDIVITHVDIDNLIRAKAAIYAGFTVLADSVGIPLEWVEQILIGGSFGKYINVEKAIEIGLLPDLPWDRFQFLGNTAIKGAYLALLNRLARERVREIANRMTYIELSADNSFYEAFISALFLPHTDLSRFPSVEAATITKQA
jgi:uncharacterized 2Fe-2S/4Fe-4S cluster protein (DUF4445 family)